jgi:hypothetical protein
MGSRHYSSSKSVAWLRKKIFKIDKPVALGWGEWAKWDAQLKKDHPIGNFFTETLPDWLEWFPEHSIEYVNDVRYYIHNWVSGTHRMNSTLKRGAWHEMSERMLFANFDTFVDFIEIEEAHGHIAWSDKEERKKYNVPWYETRWLRWFHTWRCPQAGIDHLKWEMTLDQPDPTDPNSGPNGTSPYQAKAAREKMELYTWWKHIRPTRGDSWVVSGLRPFWDRMDAKYEEDGEDGFGGWLGIGNKQKMTAAERRQYDALSKKKDEIEAEWEEEDTQMLIKLIKMRQTLWT